MRSFHTVCFTNCPLQCSFYVIVTPWHSYCLRDAQMSVRSKMMGSISISMHGSKLPLIGGVICMD